MNNLTIEEISEWVKELHIQSEKEITVAEKKEQEKYAVLVQRPTDKILLSKMLDESSQIHDNKRLAKRIKILVERYGIPKFFSVRDRVLFKMFTSIGYRFHSIAIPIFKKRLHGDTARVIINEERPLLTNHLAKRYAEGIGQNVNLLGEVVLGDNEANHRYNHYLKALEESDINYISVKISGIYAQLAPLNYSQSKIELCKRLSAIYQKAIDFPYIGENGKSMPKFVNLDMEEYKDVELTLDVFKTVLSKPEFKNYRAGIVVQAYLPDACLLYNELLKFAKKRSGEGGSPIKMRLVKGANLQMESVISSLKGWPNPVRASKIEVDANYLHILDSALKPENAKVLNVGVASHNLYTIGYAHLLSVKNETLDYITFEMLEGMANNLCRAMKSIGKQVILYTPVVKDEHFLNAVSYLVRRLDENTSKENFLSYSFNLKPDTKEWAYLLNQFTEAFNMKDNVDSTPTRIQDRNVENFRIDSSVIFRNEKDTNFELPQNRVWVDKIIERWKKSASDSPELISVKIGGRVEHSEKIIEYIDHSQQDRVVTYKLEQANLEQVKEIVEVAQNDISSWSARSFQSRHEVLIECAMNLSRRRGDLIGCAASVTGKTITEGDVEISEAIDFCRFYPYQMRKLNELQSVKCSAKGVILVISPWNFPIAIPIGGVVAALCSGNRVILKPATLSAPIAWEFAKCFWDAGVPHEALQVVSPQSGEALDYLTTHPSIKHIIFTGGTNTAFNILKKNPTCSFSAETGGKNVIILTENGDRDHAILNVVSSAFGNAGQKCSACSLLFLEKSIYDDPTFKLKLIDAVTSLQTGSVWSLNNVIGPMVVNDNEKLEYAVTHLEDGEFWLVEPKFIDRDKFILEPCVKWGVRPGSYSYENEIFAPLLSVVCIDSLEQGVEYVNNLKYGLTSGLQSLDESEQKFWKESIEAGNLYINRGITGAIVNRQPFGGMKLSAFGGGIKAGGENYITCFVDISDCEPSDVINSQTGNNFSEIFAGAQLNRFNIAVNSYKRNYESIFSKEVDCNNIYGEQNIFRYLSLKNIVLRVYNQDTLDDIALVIAASVVAKTPIDISVDGEFEKLDALNVLCKKIGGNIIVEEHSRFISRINSYSRVRSCGATVDVELFNEAAKSGLYIANSKPLVEGRLELLHYLKEQSISFEYHRYGSITDDIK